MKVRKRANEVAVPLEAINESCMRRESICYGHRNYQRDPLVAMQEGVLKCGP